MLTLKKVNKEIKARGIDAELARANGYFYFFGVSVERCYSTMIYCNSLNRLTLEQWMNDLDYFVREHDAR
jgi:hypothetical protein